MREKTKHCPHCNRTLSIDRFYKRTGPVAEQEGRAGQPYGYCKHCNKKRMTGTPYKYFSGTMHRIRRRSEYKNLEHDVDKDYLVELYNQQKGRCAITNVPLKLERGEGDVWENCSVDRIDNSIGYMQGNIRLVCRAVNMMRSNMGDELLYYWCRKILGQLDDHSGY